MGRLGKKAKQRGQVGSLRRFAKQSSAFAGLAKEDNIDSVLDNELKHKEHKPKTKCQRFRLKGKHALHSRIVLACVVFLCVVDCILVIGELILDMHAIKEAASADHSLPHHNGPHRSNDTEMGHYDPALVDHHGDKDHSIDPAYNSTRHRRASSKPAHDNAKTDTPHGSHGKDGHDEYSHGGGAQDESHGDVGHGESHGDGNHGESHGDGDHGGGHHEHSIQQQIAHAFHFASITILGILVVETIFKVFFEGREFLKKKIEMFDAFVVVVSFIIDLAFLEGITTLPLQESAYILSFILPWRVIRVVNSLVVAVLDHEHFKLLLVYKSKKHLQKEMDEAREDVHIVRKQLLAVKALCMEAGTEEWIVNQTIVRIASQFQKKPKHALSSFASFTAGAMIDEKQSFKTSIRKKNNSQDHRLSGLNSEAQKIAKLHRAIGGSPDKTTPLLKNGDSNHITDDVNHLGVSDRRSSLASSTDRPLSFVAPEMDSWEYADSA